ncbi:MAG: CotH kinase family protein [Crocinitomicaceae bacterium]
MIKFTLILFAFALSSFCVQAQSLYDIENITEIYITFEDANWDATMDTYYANDVDELLYGACSINGIDYDSVGVAFKGNSTYNASNDKNPLKIKLAEVYDFQNHQGFRTLKLSSGQKDPSFVREVLSYEIGRQYMDMPLSNYAKVYINGDYYGLFSSSESINGDYMEDHFYCDRDNMRFKCNPESVFSGNGSSLEYLGADSSSYFDYYELKSDYGWNTLVNLTSQIETNIANIEAVLDVDRALWMLAFNNVMANMDSYSGPFRQNYYLIQDDNGRVMPVIWDLNESIGGFAMVNTGGPPGGLTDLTEMDPFLRETDDEFPLIYYLFSVDRYRKMYLAHVKTMVEENLSTGDYYTRAEELQAIIDAEVQADPNAIYSYTEFTSNLDNAIGGGPNTTYGVDQILSGRESYLTSHASFSLVAPTITNVTPSNAAPLANTTVTITADIQDATYAYVGYRFYKADAFTKVEMFDDGLHNDGAAADGVYGADISLGAADMQYYIYADNADAGKFSPRRAEHEFYELTLSSGVVINELMPSNIETAADQDGEFDDWVELYNNTGSAIDLGGYFLSDDPAVLNKWIFPVGTTIEANDYLIVWCDNDILQTGLHTGFKLTSNGETVILSDASLNPINEVVFPEVSPNHTYGRYPNGTGGFIPMVPTFEAENSFTALTVDDLDEAHEIIMYPNPTNATIQFNFGTTELVAIRIYDLSGRLIKTESITSFQVMDVSGFSEGTYIVAAKDLNWVNKLIVH